MADGFRVLENGDYRITEASVFRITEQFTEAFCSLSGQGTLDNIGTRVTYGNSSLTSDGSEVSTAIKIRVVNTALSGSGSLASIGTKIFGPPLCSLEAAGTLEGTARVAKLVEASLTTQGSQVVASTGNFIGRSSLTTGYIPGIVSTIDGFTLIGDAQLSTAQYKFGIASLKTDGSGDRIVSTSPINFATGDFTVEFWIYSSAITSSTAFVFDNRNIATATGGIYIRLLSGNLYVGYNTTNVFNLAHGLTNNAWHHVALSRSGTTWRLFTNGSLLTSTTSTSLSFSGNVSYIGGVGATSLNGYMDEVRLSDTARYTSAFTPSSNAFTEDGNTVALLHFDGTLTNTYEGIVASANITTYVNSSLNANGTIASQGDLITYGLSGLNATGSIEGLGRKKYFLESSLSGSGSITALPFDSTMYTKYTGLWKESTPYVKYNGSWQEVKFIYVNENGTWRRAY